MRLALAACLLALVLGLSPLSTPSALAGGHERPGWQVIQTTHSYQDLVMRLDKAVANNQMGVVSRASATLGAKKMLKKEIPGNMVVGVYRPDFAVRMLEASVTAGIEAPIRFYITENADGSADLSYKKPTAVFAPYEDGGEALKTLAKELDVIFAKIAADAAGG